MRKQIVIALVSAVLGSAGLACQSIEGDDDDSAAGAGASGAGGTTQTGSGGTAQMTGSGGSTGSGGGGAMVFPASATSCGSGLAANFDCPAVVPLEGACAAAGTCCQRASNVAKENVLGPDDPLILDYRVQFSDTLNQAATLGIDALRSLTTERYGKEQQSILFRFKLPRKGGALIAGPAEFTNGVGRYNCDGTYSYYSDTAAPAKDGFATDPKRWAPVVTPFQFDPAKPGIEGLHFSFATTPNRELTDTPFVKTDTYEYDWELLNQGFELKSFDLSPASRECIGSRMGKVWNEGGTYWVYTPSEPNDVQPIAPLQGQTYCQLAGFGAFEKKYACKEQKRCTPFAPPPPMATPEQLAAACNWKKLPDSLCPSTPEDKALWGCHLGDEGNINKEPMTGTLPYPMGADVHCTQEKPTVAQDPDMGVTTTGQCCDPLGVSTTLPACNSYRLIQSYVVAAAHITAEPKNEIQPLCK